MNRVLSTSEKGIGDVPQMYVLSESTIIRYPITICISRSALENMVNRLEEDGELCRQAEEIVWANVARLPENLNVPLSEVRQIIQEFWGIRLNWRFRTRTWRRRNWTPLPSAMQAARKVSEVSS
jgi:hypothetical protein